MSLPESLERAATDLADLADQIRPANGDPHRLLDELGKPDSEKVLAWVLKEAPEDADELLEAWGESDAGVAILLSVDDGGIPKAGRKMLRRARHRLRSQGVEVAEDSRPAPVKRKVAAVSDRWQAAHLSTPDFRGARMGYLVDSHPSGGARLFEIRFDEGRGILDFEIYNAGRSKVRGFLKSLTAGSAQRLFEVDRDALRALVYRASQAQPTDRPLPTSYVEWRGRLFPEELEKTPTPGAIARETLGEAPLESSLEAATEEIRTGGLGPWPPKTAWVGDWMERGREAVEGLEGDARGSAIDAWIADVGESLGTETDLPLVCRHLEELAWVRWQMENEEGGKQLLAIASALAKDDSVATRFHRARVESLFEPFLAELRVVEVSATED